MLDDIVDVAVVDDRAVLVVAWQYRAVCESLDSSHRFKRSPGARPVERKRSKNAPTRK